MFYECGIFTEVERILCGNYLFCHLNFNVGHDDAAGLLDHHDPDNRVGVATAS